MLAGAQTVSTHVLHYGGQHGKKSGEAQPMLHILCMQHANLLVPSLSRVKKNIFLLHTPGGLELRFDMCGYRNFNFFQMRAGAEFLKKTIAAIEVLTKLLKIYLALYTYQSSIQVINSVTLVTLQKTRLH